jgi:hypothetical protein
MMAVTGIKIEPLICVPPGEVPPAEGDDAGGMMTAGKSLILPLRTADRVAGRGLQLSGRQSCQELYLG